MYRIQPDQAPFEDADFRQYNAAGYEELLASLATARAKAAAAQTIEDKRIASVHLDSVEHLWKLSRQLAQERFEHAREEARRKVQAAMRLVGPAPAANRRVLLEQAIDAFHRKDFVAAAALAEAVRSPAAAPIPIVPAVAADVAAKAQTVELVESALACHRQHRWHQAYLLYLDALVRQPGNRAIRPRLHAVGNRRPGARV